MTSTSDHELRINAALGKILRNFNFLELNLGLSIRFLEKPEDVEQSHPMLARTGIVEKLKRFKKLLEAEGLIKDKEEFDKWYQDANDARCVRNFFIHGKWDPFLLEKKIHIQFSLPPWRNESLRGESKIKMSLDELESDAQQIQDVFEKFCIIRRKYNV